MGCVVTVNRTVRVVLHAHVNPRLAHCNKQQTEYSPPPVEQGLSVAIHYNPMYRRHTIRQPSLHYSTVYADLQYLRGLQILPTCLSSGRPLCTCLQILCTLTLDVFCFTGKALARNSTYYIPDAETYIVVWRSHARARVWLRQTSTCSMNSLRAKPRNRKSSHRHYISRSRARHA